LPARPDISVIGIYDDSMPDSWRNPSRLKDLKVKFILVRQ